MMNSYIFYKPSLKNWNYTVILIASVFAFQILDNKYWEIMPFITAGEALLVFSVPFLTYGLLKSSITTGLYFYFFAVFSCLYLLLTGLSFYFSISPGSSFRFFVTVLVQVLFSLLVMVNIREGYYEKIFLIFGLVAILSGALNVLNVYVPNFELLQVRTNAGRSFFGFNLGSQRAVSVTNIYAQLGSHLVLGSMFLIGFFVQKKHETGKYIYILLSCLTGLLFILSVISLQSRATFISTLLSIVLFVFIFLKRKTKIFVVFLSFVLILWLGFINKFFYVFYNEFVGMRAGTVFRRLEQYSHSIDIIAENPVGIGHGTFKETVGHGAVLHNTILDSFVSSGWIGGISFLILLILPVLLYGKREFLKQPIFSGLLSGYIGVLFLSNFHTGTTSILYILTSSIIVACYYTKGQQLIKNGKHFLWQAVRKINSGR